MKRAGFKSIRNILTASLLRQLALGIAVVHAVLMTIFVFDLVDRQRDFLNEQSRKQTIGLARTLAVNSASWVLARDVVGLEEVLVSQRAYPNLFYAMILDPVGKVLAHSDIDKVGKYISDEQSLSLLEYRTEPTVLLESSLQVDVAVPVLSNDTHIGWARVGISKETIKTGLQILTQKGILYTLVAIVVGTVFAVFMAFRITRGLRQLTVVTDRIGKGDVEVRSDLDRSDEIGALSNAVNQMAEALARQAHLESKARQELQTHQDQLEAKVQERTKELSKEVAERRHAESELVKAKFLAEAASTAKSEFLANMSHEIRTPLNGVMGMLQLIRTTPLSREQKESIQLALASSQTLLSVINDVLDLSKIEAGKLELSEVEFDPSALLNSLTGLFRMQAESKYTNFHCTLGKNIPSTLQGDPDRIKQILLNLIGNAVKFTEQGEIRVQMTTEPVENDTDRVNLTFSVSDTGIGIAQDKLETIFEPFTQGDGSITRKYGGTGLGLSIVKRLVDLLGGSVQLKSQLGVGTTVCIHVPVKAFAGGDAALVKAPAATIVPLTELRILLAEDDPANRLVARCMLEKQGHFVTCVTTGLEALAALDRETFDLVLMDIQMPEMDGTEATIEIRKDPRFKDLPVIALTAHAMTGDRKRILDAGMNDYLFKPIDMEELKEVMARVVVN